jgi:hypothetical protein
MMCMSDPHGWARTEHDTMVIPTGAGTPPAGPYPGQPYAGPSHPGKPYAGPSHPGQDAAYWQAKYRRQRTWMGVVAGMALLALLGVVGLGFAAYQAFTNNPIVAAVQDLGQGLQGGEDRGDPAPVLPEDGDPQDPESSTEVPGATGVPLPEQLQDLGQAFGITDVGQLLDLAVAQGLMSQEQADQLRAALQAGRALGELGQGFAQEPSES